MTSPTETRPLPSRGRTRAALDSDVVAFVIAALVALCVKGVALRGPAFVEEVGVRNPSEYDMGVWISGGDGSGRIALAAAAQRATTVTQRVIDQGDAWIFHFEAQGLRGGELRITVRDLEQAGWVVTVPDDVIRRLREAGAPPSP